MNVSPLERSLLALQGGLLLCSLIVQCFLSGIYSQIRCCFLLGCSCNNYCMSQYECATKPARVEADIIMCNEQWNDRTSCHRIREWFNSFMINKGILLGPHKFFYEQNNPSLSCVADCFEQRHWKTGCRTTIMLHSLGSVATVRWQYGWIFPGYHAPATSSHTMGLLPISFEHNSDFSAAVFPLALIAQMVHNLPYLFPPDPEPPPSRKCYFFAPIFGKSYW